MLRIGDLRGVSEYLSSEDWDYVFSPLLSNQTSLEAIYVQCDETGMFGAVLNQIGKLLAKGSTLEILWFSSLSGMQYSWIGCDHVSDAVVKTLSEGLIHSKCLRTVVVTEVGGPVEKRFADVLKSACTTDVQNTSLEWIDLPAAMERLDMALEMLLSNSFKNLKMIHIGLRGDADESTVDKFQMVAECLRRCQQPDFDTSRIVHLDYDLRYAQTYDYRVMEIWDKWVRANEGPFLLETRLLVLGYGGPYGWELRERWGAVVCEMLTPSTQLKSLHICFEWDYYNFRGEQPTWLHNMETSFSLLCKNIQSIDSVESISIRGQEEILVKCGPPLFHCLHHKRRLKELTCNGPWYVDEVFRSLMDLLQVNIYLEVVNLDKYDSEDNGGDEGKVLVQEALRRNREQRAYFSTLRDAKLPCEEAKAARVFLCGHPFAGKTTLRVTMMETKHCQKESRIRKYWTRKFDPLRRKTRKGVGLPLKRTKGVDVELLRDDAEMQISVWTLRGRRSFEPYSPCSFPL
ncbi:hypothetical protein R1sor_004988 [Riccia sorocarpa]|uniref:Uncharacterized protein n=1 Tax=Riccia sorocarpa TaxID=122646 RepID=A0ABD3HIJ0_9MARC